MFKVVQKLTIENGFCTVSEVIHDHKGVEIVSEAKKKINPAKDPYQTILRVMEDAEHHGMLGLTVIELRERLEKKNMKLSQEEILRALGELEDATFVDSQGRPKGKMYFLTDEGINWIG